MILKYLQSGSGVQQEYYLLYFLYRRGDEKKFDCIRVNHLLSVTAVHDLRKKPVII